jgi:hypothetical protein
MGAFRRTSGSLVGARWRVLLIDAADLDAVVEHLPVLQISEDRLLFEAGAAKRKNHGNLG